jgi:N-acetylglucosaminyldiphosphoundecaprenol N-acetyl-beta-D-mannosaminyltransferase
MSEHFEFPHEDGPRPRASGEIVHEMDDFDVETFAAVAARFGQDHYGFVVTPNVDHLIRFHEDAAFRALYESAAYVLLDSRFASRLLRLFKGLRLRVCPGADLTACLLTRVVRPADRIVVVGGTPDQTQRLVQAYRLENVRHHNPPMGFIDQPPALEECLEFIEHASPFRFCFLAVGSPQQERVAELLQRRAKARGLALCVGASINFLTGTEQRAPLYMQRAGLEWLYRLLRNPTRLASRYLVRGPRIFLHLRRARIVLRKPPGAGPGSARFPSKVRLLR